MRQPMRSSASAAPAIERHPLVTRVLHWATAVILVVSVSAILYRETTEQKTLRQVLMELHRQLGLLVLLLLVARVAVAPATRVAGAAAPGGTGGGSLSQRSGEPRARPQCRQASRGDGR